MCIVAKQASDAALDILMHRSPGPFRILALEGAPCASARHVLHAAKNHLCMSLCVLRCAARTLSAAFAVSLSLSLALSVYLSTTLGSVRNNSLIYTTNNNFHEKRNIYNKQLKMSFLTMAPVMRSLVSDISINYYLRQDLGRPTTNHKNLLSI